MIGAANDALVARLASLSQAERVDFARWALAQPPPPAVSVDGAGSAASRNVKNAAIAFHAASWPFEFMFDPLFPESWAGRDAANAGEAVVRAMAAALATDDRQALDALTPAFERLRLKTGDRPARHG